MGQNKMAVIATVTQVYAGPAESDVRLNLPRITVFCTSILFLFQRNVISEMYVGPTSELTCVILLFETCNYLFLNYMR